MLFEPYQMGALRLQNRVVMAPMTRSRAIETNTPNALMAEYYGIPAASPISSICRPARR